MRPFIMLTLLLTLAAPAQVLACSWRSPAGERKAEKERQAYLAKADRVVVGVWTPTGLSDDDQTADGKIDFKQGGQVGTVLAHAPTEFVCGFPNYPYTQPAIGTFYLKDGAGSRATVLHFEPAVLVTGRIASTAEIGLMIGDVEEVGRAYAIVPEHQSASIVLIGGEDCPGVAAVGRRFTLGIEQRRMAFATRNDAEKALVSDLAIISCYADK